MSVVFALVVLYASLDALVRRRPGRRSSGVVVDEAAPRRWLSVALRAIGSAAVAAALALGFSDGASAQAVDTAAAESVVVVDSAAEPPVTPTDAPAASVDPPPASTAVDVPPAMTPPAAAATSPATDPTLATTGPPTTDPAAGAPATTPASGDAIPAGDAATANAAASTPPTADATAATGPADPSPAAGEPITDAAAAAAFAVAAAPGTPGTPQPATVVFDEDFQNRPGPTPIVDLAGYTGTTGQTYTAAPEWLALCNGWISSAGQPPNAAVPIADCDGGTGSGQIFWNESQQLSQALAMALGQSAADAQGNYAVSAFTTNNPGDGKVEFETTTNIAFVTPNRFVTFSVDVSAINCNQTHPLLQFFLLDDSGGATPTGTQIDPCTGAITVNVPAIGVKGAADIVVGTYTTNDPVLISGSSIGVRMVNNNGSGAGNDLAFDNIKIFDVTPQLDKSFSSDEVGVGQTATLTLTVTNTDDLAAKNGWSFIDNLPAGLIVAGAATTTCPAGVVTAPIGGSTISVGGNLDADTVSCTVTVQVTSSTTGSFTNDASSFASVVGMSLPNPATVIFTSEPALTIAKSSTTVTIPPVGQTIPYSFLVTNTGNVTLTGIAVTDPNTPGISCPVTTLAPNESTTCTGTHTVVQADLDAGSVVNTASIVGTPPVGAPIPPMPSNQVTIPGLQSPALSIVKSSTTTSATAVGQVIPYTFTVTNTGNVTITNVAVSDPKLGAVTCPVTTLAPGSSTVCTGSYTATAGDLDNGQPIVNTATVTGTPPPSAPALPPSSANTVTVTVVQSPALTIVKSSPTTSATAVGQVIPYTFTVTNTGNVTITNVAVSDPKLGAVTCPVTTLAPGSSTVCTGSYTATAGDLDNGQPIVNTATVTGTPPPSAPALPPSSANTVTVTVVQSPALSIVIASPTTSVTAVGQVIPYTFTVTNTGNVTITGGAVSDRRVGAVTCPVTTLAPGSSTVCTGSYTATAGDLDSGQPIVNTATVTGTPPPSAPALPLSSANTVTVTVVQSPALTIVKSSPTTSATAVGQVIPYTFLVTNTGNVTMTSVVVNDPKVGSVTCPQTTIAAGASMTCTASYTLSEADVTAGQVVNTASVVGTPPSGTPITAVVSNQAVIAVSSLPPDLALPPVLALVHVASPAAPTASLPATGADAESMLRIAAVVAALGAGLIMVSRRRKRLVR